MRLQVQIFAAGQAATRLLSQSALAFGLTFAGGKFDGQSASRLWINGISGIRDGSSNLFLHGSGGN